MSDQLPMIRVLGFKTKYENLPVKGDPLNDNVDNKGWKLDASGKVIKEMQAAHYVSYAPAHSPLNTVITEAVRHMIPDLSASDDKDGAKLAFMSARWSQIEPAYQSFMAGQDIPINGTPLGAWAGINADQAEVFRQNGIRSVEEIAALTDGQIDRIRLPAVRDIRRQATLFLENSVSAQAAQREAEKDALIEEMRAEQQAMRELLEELTAPKAKRGRPPKAGSDELDEEEAA